MFFLFVDGVRLHRRSWVNGCLASRTLGRARARPFTINRAGWLPEKSGEGHVFFFFLVTGEKQNRKKNVFFFFALGFIRVREGH